MQEAALGNGGETYVGYTHVLNSPFYHSLIVATDRLNYNFPDDVRNDPDRYDLQEVTRPDGMSWEVYDEEVKVAANEYFSRTPHEYSIAGNSCNTTTATIIRESGGSVTPNKSVPGSKKW